jgi:uncharacterized protein (TIGR01440 family)
MDAYRDEARQALAELLSLSRIEAGSVAVVGGSTSEVQGQRIGSRPAIEIGELLIDGLLEAAGDQAITLAVQCCEHLNRALVLPRSVARARGLQEVTARPVPGAGGALAAAYYGRLGDEACLVANIAAEAGLDIGDTLIGMHLRPVAVPVRLGITAIGKAHLVGARTRPPLIGGARALCPVGRPT